MVRQCVSHAEGWNILHHCYSGVVGGYFSENLTIKKILEACFFCPSMFHDAQKFVNLTKHDEMKKTPIQQCEMFDVWKIYFMDRSILHFIMFS